MPMVSRRAVVFGLFLLPISRAFGAPKRRSTRVPGRVYATKKSAAPLRVLDAAVFSIANDNDRYVAVVQLETLPKDGPVLVLASGEVKANSWGSQFGDSPGKGAASFEFDRARADEVAKLWGVARRDRVPLGVGLFARWKAKGRFVVGKPMPIVLTLENTGTAPVWFNTGGRQRGPRDNRFVFGASRDGAALPVITAYDFGGLGSVQPLEPGTSVERSEDLTRWIAVDRPGSYKVTCHYELELTTGTDGGQWPARGHELWDWATDDVIDVNVG
jgi:hypothetical protein